MPHPLKCPNCDDYRLVSYKGVRFENEEETKGYGVQIPTFECPSCGWFESICPKDRYLDFKENILPSFKDGEFIEMPLKFIFSKLDEDATFSNFDHLGFKYDPRDYFLIPGLRRKGDDGYLTPVFFDKDLLLYYNNHPDYTVNLTSHSSGNIYCKGEPMFEWGFGINRSGKIFKWLGDLDKDFADEAMMSHLRRFQASNVPSDHDIFSKFYLSQNPFDPKDAFQEPDNETMLFRLNSIFNTQILKTQGVALEKIPVADLFLHYRHPILEEPQQIFSAYLSLDKYLIENMSGDSLRAILMANRLKSSELEKDGKRLGTLKLFSLFIEHVLKKENASALVAPLFILNDLRQLHGHLVNASFNRKYSFCKERLGLRNDASDMELFTSLISSLISMYKELVAQ